MSGRNTSCLCVCSKQHVPLPNRYVEVDVPGRGVLQLCPTAHDNLQLLLTSCREFGKLPPGNIRKAYGRFIQEIAQCIFEGESNI